MIYKTTPWKHQQGAYDFVLRHGRGAMIALPMGAGGKTKIAIDILQNVEAKRVLIVCPKPVIEVWKEEFDKHAIHRQDWCVIECSHGSIAQRLELAQGVAEEVQNIPVIVINYDAVWREPFRSWALDQSWDVVIADESHRIKGAGTKVSWFFKTLKKRTRFALALSGTPMPHSPLDLYAQARFIDDRIFGTSKADFIQRYAFVGGYSGHQVLGWQRMDELNRKFHKFAYHVPDSELDVQMPKEIDVRRYTALEPSAEKQYRELQREFITQVKNKVVTAANAAVKILRFQQLTGGFLRDTEKVYHQVSHAKLDLLLDLLSDLLPAEPVLIFCRFKPELALIGSALRQIKRSAGELSGSRNDLAAWQRGDYLDLVAQVQAGAEGVDLTRSRYTIYYSPGVSLGKYDQTRRRTARPNQRSAVTTYIHLLCRKTYDETIYRGFKEAKDIIQLVLDEIAESGEVEASAQAGTADFSTTI